MTQATLTPTPFPYNLLELYRTHRDEVETFSDSTALFILAYVNLVKKINQPTLWRDIRLEDVQMLPRMRRLVRGNMLAEKNEDYTVTPLGKELLNELDLLEATLPPPSDTPTPKKASRPTVLPIMIGCYVILFVLLIIIAAYLLISRQS